MLDECIPLRAVGGRIEVVRETDRGEPFRGVGDQTLFLVGDVAGNKGEELVDVQDPVFEGDVGTLPGGLVVFDPGELIGGFGNDRHSLQGANGIGHQAGNNLAWFGGAFVLVGAVDRRRFPGLIFFDGQLTAPIEFNFNRGGDFSPDFFGRDFLILAAGPSPPFRTPPAKCLTVFPMPGVAF